MPDIRLADAFQGPFELVGETELGAEFASVQSVASEALGTTLLDLDEVPSWEARQPEFEVNTVNWTTAPDGTISGTAKFLAVRNHHVVNARLSGETSAPVGDEGYRLARVIVTFVGGTGPYEGAGGEARVVAKLFDDGTSVGYIEGAVTVPE